MATKVTQNREIIQYIERGWAEQLQKTYLNRLFTRASHVEQSNIKIMTT